MIQTRFESEKRRNIRASMDESLSLFFFVILVPISIFPSPAIHFTTQSQFIVFAAFVLPHTAIQYKYLFKKKRKEHTTLKGYRLSIYSFAYGCARRVCVCVRADTCTGVFFQL